MTQKWMIKNKADDFTAICKEQGISEVTARLLVNRGLDSKPKRDAYLHPSLENGLNPAPLLLHAKEAAALLYEKVREGKKIRIIGDYDVDGIISVYVLFQTLRQAGGSVDYRIPDRVKDGYGMNDAMVREAICDGVDTIVTCDNGIAALEPICHAKEAGLTVVLTDHHEIGTQKTEAGEQQVLPAADVIVNPKQWGETTPQTEICGAVVAFKVMQCFAKLSKSPAKQMLRFLPYLAMATVCDVMELTGENRAIVILGLRAIQSCQEVGLRALIRENRLELEQLTAYHIGFVLGPCLNASGRLDTAKKGLELLLEECPAQAERLAAEVTQLNQTRKDMTARCVEQAVTLVEERQQLERVLVLFLPDCHESLAGIVAGRIRERYYRPTIVLTRAEGCVKGSGRSIEGYSMFEEISRCRELLTRFGGHPMAAGMSLPEEHVEAFREKLNALCTLTEEELTERLSIDVVLPFGLVTEQLIAELRLLEPFGKGNAKPMFAERKVRVLRAALLGRNANVLKLQLENSFGRRFSAVYFGDIPAFEETMTAAFGAEQLQRMFQGRENNVTFSMIYYPEKNVYAGNTELQAVMLYYLV